MREEGKNRQNATEQNVLRRLALKIRCLRLAFSRSGDIGDITNNLIVLKEKGKPLFFPFAAWFYQGIDIIPTIVIEKVDYQGRSH